MGALVEPQGGARVFSSRYLLLALAAAGWGCAPHPTAISPAELSELEARVAREPANGPLRLRYAAALAAADRCTDAIPAGRRGMTLTPKDALGPMVVGRCLEQGGQYDEAITTYRTFLATNPEGRGVGAIRAREQFAVRASAVQVARQALAQEAELSQQPADPQTIAVLPVNVVGDSTYQSLSRGLAQMLTSDLALLERFRLVERMRLGALLDEMQLAQGGKMDEATAARVGRLMRAGRMVQGVAEIPGERNVKLEASVIAGTGEVSTAAQSGGSLRDLLSMEKEIVVGLARRLGYTLSEAERQSILENGTRNITAFLAYSRALEAEDRGDYAAAARYYGQAVQADPSFRQARDGYTAATAAPDVQVATAADAPVVAGQDIVPAVPDLGEDVGTAIGSTVADLAPTTSEQTTAIAGTSATTAGTTATATTTATAPPPAVVQPVTIIGTIRIVFRLP